MVYFLMRYAAVIERIFLVLEVLVWNSSDQVSCSGFHAISINAVDLAVDVCLQATDFLG